MQHELVTISCSFLRNFLTPMKLCNFKPDQRLMSSPITFTESPFVNTNHRCCQRVLFILFDPIALDNVMFETEELFVFRLQNGVHAAEFARVETHPATKMWIFACGHTGRRKEEHRRNGKLISVQRNLDSIESYHLLLLSSFRFETSRCRRCRIQSRYQR